jgi:hypothetical protein
MALRTVGLSLEFLVSASEFVVCGTETVPFRRRLPETAAVDVDGVAGGSVAALGGVLHDSGTALVAVVLVASPQSLQCCLGTTYWLKPVLRIHDIFGWIQIRIRGSMHLTCGSGSFYFHH